MWKRIEEYPEYSVSDEGQVKNNKTNRILSPGYNEGYAVVQLWKNKKPYMKRVHRLVLETFCPIKDSQNLEVNHLDRNPKNNCLSNLEWCTSKENIKYRDMYNNPNLHRKKVKVSFLNGEIKYFNSVKECAEYFGVHTTAIYDYMKTELTPRRKVQAIFTYFY